MRTELHVHSGPGAGSRTGAIERRAKPTALGGGILLAVLVLAAPTPLPAQEAPTLRVVPGLAILQQVAADQVLTGDHTVAEGESVDDIVVVGGDLRIRGEVRGDAVVVGGNLILESSGSVLGDAVVTGGEIVDNGGRIRGEMRMLHGSGGAVAEEIREAITEGAQVDARQEAVRAGEEAARAGEEAARAARETARIRMDRGSRSWFDPIKRGFAGLISTVALGLLLAGIGAALIFYGRSYLDTVSDTLRSNTLRSLGVGVAAGFLVVPAFVVLVVALAVSIIGIPLLLVAVPAYLLAVPAAGAFGLLAAAHAIGERTAEQRNDSFDLRHRNAYSYLFTGLGMMLLPLVAAHLLHMTGFLGFLGGLLEWMTYAALWVAATAGFGAVILSRLGTRRSFVAPHGDMEYDRDPLFEDDPSARGPHV